MPSNIYLEALHRCVLRHHEDGAYGVLLIGLPDLPVRALAQALGGPNAVAVSLIDYPDASDTVAWARAEGWNEARFGADEDATHAVRVRNDDDLPNDIIRLAIAQEEVARLHSLQEGWYQRIGIDEVTRQIAKIGAEHAPNQPQEYLWEALASETIVSYLSLEDLIRYYETVFDEDADPIEIETPRAALPLLHLLKDGQLLSGRTGSIRQRLEKNANMVDRLQQPTDKDERRAAQNAQQSPMLKRAYQAFTRLRRGDLDALSDLALPEAEQLFAKPKPSSDKKVNDSSGDTSEDRTEDDVPRYDHLGEAAVELAIRDSDEDIGDVMDGALKHLSRDRLKKRSVETRRAKVDFEPDEHAAAIVRATIGDSHFGGTLHADSETLDGLLATSKPGYHFDRERFTLYDDVRVEQLRSYLERAQDLDPEFRGARLLDEYLEKRKALTRPADLATVDEEDSSSTALTHAHVLAHEELAFTYLVARPNVLKMAREAIDAYQRFLSHLGERFHVLQNESPQGAVHICNEVLGLDLVMLHGADGETGALLSPINPLALWKHHAMAELVLDRRQKLNEVDRALLQEEVKQTPEPLLALHAPGSSDGEGTDLIHAGRIGSLPLYRPSRVQIADVNAESLQRAAEKLAALYPPAQEHLRIVLLNPHSLAEAAHALKKLLTKKRGFNHVSLLVARFGSAPASSRLSLGTDLDELHAEGKVTLETIQAADLDDLADQLQHCPAHILAVAGEQYRTGSIVRRESTRLHPLSIPKRLEADGITGQLSLQPRSSRPPEGQPHHPYGLYHNLVSTLTRKPRRDHSLREHQRISLTDHRPLLKGAPFYVVAGMPEEGTSTDDIMRLAQGGGTGSDAVFTQLTTPRIMRSVTNLLTESNYAPTEEGIRKLLRRVEEVGGEGLFSAITDKEHSGFSKKKLQGHIGLAVALGWYEALAEDEEYLVLSLDSPLAHQWLGQREDGRRADLLGFRRTEDGSLAVDVIEVKSYAATGEEHITESQAAQQIDATAQVLESMLRRQGDLLIDCRRERLRLQVYQEGLLNRSDVDRAWVQALNQLLDGEADARLERLLIEVHLKENEPLKDQTFEQDGVAIRRIRLAESAVQKHLSGVLEPSAPPRSSRDASTIEGSSTDTSESVPSTETASAQESTNGSPSQSSPHPSATSSSEPDDAPGEESTERKMSGETPANDQVAPEKASEGITSAEGERLSFAPDAEEHARIDEKAKGIYKALQDHRIELAGAVDPNDAEIGPNIVRYKVRLKPGERVTRIKSTTKDLMRELAIRKEPIVGNLPGTRFVHVDVPRPERQTAPLLPVLEATTERTEQRDYAVPAGVEPDGNVRWLSIPKMPHMLVAGATGSGKSVFLRSLIVSLATLNSPDALQLVLVDPKRTDFGLFKRLPHLRGSQGVITDPQEAIDVLSQLVNQELEERTHTLEEALYMDIHDYNADHPTNLIPPIVVFVDEFADLSDVMNTSDQREDFNLALRRLAQRARSVGIHLVLATQRPTADIIDGTIKANLPCRVSFRLESNVDSRTVLDQGGAEHLLGSGDMLLRHAGETTRLQGLFLSNDKLREALRNILQDRTDA